MLRRATYQQVYVFCYLTDAESASFLVRESVNWIPTILVFLSTQIKLTHLLTYVRFINISIQVHLTIFMYYQREICYNYIHHAFHLKL